MKLVHTLLPAVLATALSPLTLAKSYSEPVSPLGRYNIDLSQTSVSGISSGGFMTVQMHAAHADSIVGVGVFAGGPYLCSGHSNQISNVSTALNVCMAGEADAELSLSELEQAEKRGDVAPIEAQKSDKVWLYSGYNDGVVKQPTMDALAAYYSELTNEGHVYYRDNQNAGHAQIVDNSKGQECVLNGGEFINDCQLDGAGRILEFIYGDLNARQTGALSGQIIAFDQSPWFNNSSKAVMADTAYVYVPEACANGQSCRLHIAFHGCLQNAESINDSFYRYAGYNEWADTNNFVVLYPQTTQTSNIFIPGEPFNPKGCWDWWGFTDPASSQANYATKSSRQIQAIWNMATHLASDFTPATTTKINTTPTKTSTPPDFNLSAADSSDKAVSLVWDSQPGVSYNLSMRADGENSFSPVNNMPIRSGSFSVTDLEANTNYEFRLSLADDPQTQSPIVSMQTGSPAAECNPWYGTLTEHITAFRAYAIGSIFATGSNDYLGMWYEANKADATLLQTGPAFYKKGNCPEN